LIGVPLPAIAAGAGASDIAATASPTKVRLFMLPPCLVAELRRPPRSAAAALEPQVWFRLGSSLSALEEATSRATLWAAASRLVKMV